MLDIAIANEIELDHNCGGSCACTTCHVIVKEGAENLSEKEEDEEDRLDFDALQNRIHPAESRITMLAEETPADLVVFDLIAHDGDDLRSAPFSERRNRLERLLPTLKGRWHLTPSTTDRGVGARWFGEFEAAGCDGIVAKALDGPYVEGKREMVKVKHRRTVDCVVGGYRVHKDGKGIGSILLGLAVGSRLEAGIFLRPETLGIVTLGLFAFAIGESNEAWGFVIGASLATVGLIMVLGQTTLLRLMVPRLGERRAALTSIAVAAVGYAGYATATAGWMMFAWLATWLFGATVMPTTNAIMSHRVAPDAQGELQGVVASLFSLSAIVGPPLMSQLFGRFTAPDALVHLPGAAFLAAALLTAVCWVIYWAATREAPVAAPTAAPEVGPGRA